MSLKTKGPFAATNDYFKKTERHMGVSKNNGTPKWMVYKGNPY